MDFRLQTFLRPLSQLRYKDSTGELTDKHTPHDVGNAMRKRGLRMVDKASSKGGPLRTLEYGMQITAVCSPLWRFLCASQVLPLQRITFLADELVTCEILLVCVHSGDRK